VIFRWLSATGLSVGFSRNGYDFSRKETHRL
jgi:hypothetical protein